MRKLVVTEFVSLDGVMEAPGGDDGYVHGAWTMPFWCDEVGAYKSAELFAADALLLGRRTYEGFAAAWPERGGDPFSDAMNSMAKHVVSRSLTSAEWANSHILRGDMEAAVRALKEADGADILVAGSASVGARTQFRVPRPGPSRGATTLRDRTCEMTVQQSTPPPRPEEPTSIAGVVGLPGRNAYGAAKAGIVSMTRSMASEWGATGVRVNAIAPGYIKTPMVDDVKGRGRITDDMVWNRTPLRREGVASEIAGPVLFLCSPAASYITGACLMVDGGWAAYGGIALQDAE